MFSKLRSQTLPILGTIILCICLSWGLVSCGDRLEPPAISAVAPPALPVTTGKLSEVAPPAAIQELGAALERYQPQVKILSPQADEILSDTTVEVRLQVQDLPIFKDPDLGLGPHLHLFLDDEPYRATYDTDKLIVLENLEPGTHTLRAFTSRPWHESFKNDGAYAQTTFHVLTKTTANAPTAAKPLLTYSRPQGSYGAEPIMLDFYLTNAPLHEIARANPDDAIPDWRIRATINGESFLIDNWQPVYLKGFAKGKNWIKLELLDGQGNPIDNAFNSTVRVITYNPKGQDTLAKLMRGELTAAAARGIVEPGYKAKLTPTPGLLLPEPVIEATPAPEEPAPAVEVAPVPEEPAPAAEVAPVPPETPDRNETVTPAAASDELERETPAAKLPPASDIPSESLGETK